MLLLTFWLVYVEEGEKPCSILVSRRILAASQGFLKSEELTSTLGSSRETCEISAELLLSS